MPERDMADINVLSSVGHTMRNELMCGLAVLGAVLTASGCVVQPVSGESNALEVTSDLSTARQSALVTWSEQALAADALDHTPPASGEARIAGEQFGPLRSSRAFAIVHLAMYDAVQSIGGEYRTYTAMPCQPHVDMDAAIAVAAHDTLVNLYPSQTPIFARALRAELSANLSPTRQAGMDVGARAAERVLRLRTNDGSQRPEPNYGDLNLKVGPGMWAPDAVSQATIALGGYWMNVTPFALTSAQQFRAPAPYALSSVQWRADLDDVRDYGGDGVHAPTLRTKEQEQVGRFWGYDIPAKIGTPPRLYNQIAMTVARRKGLINKPAELSRLLAAVNVSMADAAISAWESKYFYNVWRPTNAIRATAVRDGGDPNWTALGAAASNSPSPTFMPPFPAYPSGHATIGGALFETLEQLVGDTSFTQVSDEFNGITTDSNGRARPFLPRTFLSLKDAEAENARSRTFIGIHWRHDETAGIKMGNSVSNYVVKHFFTKR